MEAIPVPNMACQICSFFLQDFLLTGVPEGISFRKDLKLHILPRISHSFADWIHRVFQKLTHTQIKNASMTAARIAKRGRPAIEYDFVVSTATFNFLKYEAPWLQEEEEFIAISLMERGLFRGKKIATLTITARDYIRYITIKAIKCLEELHEDHRNPKGLLTNLGAFAGKTPTNRSEELEKTLYDRDTEYQKEILEEIGLEDLYT